MKLEKKHWAMLIAGVVILFLVYWFFFRKKKSESGYDSNILIYGNDENSFDAAFPMIGESGYVAGGKCFTEICPCDISNNKCTCDTKLVSVPCGNVVNSPWKLSGSGKVVKVPGKTFGTAGRTMSAGRMAGRAMVGSVGQESSYLACHYTCPKVTSCSQYNSAGNCTQWTSMCKCAKGLVPMEQTGFGQD